MHMLQSFWRKPCAADCFCAKWRCYIATAVSSVLSTNLCNNVNLVSEQVRVARSQQIGSGAALVGPQISPNSNLLPDCEATPTHPLNLCEVAVVTWFRQHHPSLCRAYSHANSIKGVVARMLLSRSRFALTSVLSWSRCTISVFGQCAAYSSSSSQNSARKASPSFDQVCSMMPCFHLFVCSLHRECML